MHNLSRLIVPLHCVIELTCRSFSPVTWLKDGKVLQNDVSGRPTHVDACQISPILLPKSSRIRISIPTLLEKHSLRLPIFPKKAFYSRYDQ